MKKLLMLGVVLVGLVYALPYAAGRVLSLPPQENTVQTAAETPLHTNENSGQTEENLKIIVKIQGKPKEMLLEDYVAGVVAAEIAPTFPKEALRAQAVAARTYAVFKQAHGRPAAHEDADVCDDFAHCAAYIDLETQAEERWGERAQEYRDTVRQAVDDTKGEVMMHKGEPIIAVFCAASGPRTEASGDVWGGEIPYLQSVESPGGEACGKYRDSVHFTTGEMRDRCAAAFPKADLSGSPKTWFRDSERTAAGGIKTVMLGGIRISGSDVRGMLGLNSANFTIEPTDSGITFHTIGYGHGVGLSQYGAKYMAEQGKGYQEILTHYYKDVTIEKLP